MSAPLPLRAVRDTIAAWERDRAERQASPPTLRANEARRANLSKALASKHDRRSLEEVKQRLAVAEARVAKLALHNQQLRAAVASWGRGYGWLLLDPEEQKRRRK